MTITPVQRRIAQIAYGKQSAQGTPATNPTFVVGLLSGRVVETEVQMAELNPTWNSVTVEGYDRLLVVPGLEFECPATPGFVGALLQSMLGSDSVTGTGPYVHTMTDAQDEPYSTWWGKFGSAYYQVSDAKIEELDVSWDKNGALKVKGKVKGCTINFAPGAWGGSPTSERVSGGYLSGGNSSVFNIDGGAAGAIVSGSLKFMRKMDPIVISGSATPGAMFPGMFTCASSLKVIPNDASYWRKILTGSTTGTSVQSQPYYGSLSFTWNDLIGDSLSIAEPRVRFLSQFPDVNTAGGPAEITIEGEMVSALSGADVTATLTNGVASY